MIHRPRDLVTPAAASLDCQGLQGSAGGGRALVAGNVYSLSVIEGGRRVEVTFTEQDDGSSRGAGASKALFQRRRLQSNDFVFCAVVKGEREREREKRDGVQVWGPPLQASAHCRAAGLWPSPPPVSGCKVLEAFSCSVLVFLPSLPYP